MKRRAFIIGAGVAACGLNAVLVLGSDDLIIEHDGYAGLNIRSPATTHSRIFFGDPGGSTGHIKYDHNTTPLELFV